MDPITATIFDIQRFSLNDGGGIRTIVFFKGCPLRCQWCSNPESQVAGRQLLFWQNRCIGCGSCAKVCPEGVGCRQVNSDVCVYCGKCAEACPSKALALSGQTMTVDDVVARIKRDRPFYQHSGGGVTFSGGEVLLQWEFAAQLAETLQSMMIDTAVETCGLADWEHAWTLFRHCDRILYDMKAMDPELHRRFTGCDNEIILRNARNLGKTDKEVIYRVPLIHEVNDSDENISALCRLALENHVREIHLLPYHEYGAPKYVALGKEYTFKAQAPDDRRIEELRGVIDAHGLRSLVGG